MAFEDEESHHMYLRRRIFQGLTLEYFVLEKITR